MSVQHNPFSQPSTLPFRAPPFDRIKDSDYLPAIEAGIAEKQQEVARIASDPQPPTFENTYVALEKRPAATARNERVRRDDLRQYQ